MTDLSLIRCKIHGNQPWYVMCWHIAKGTVPTHWVEPDDKRPGEILCAACVLQKPTVEKVVAICTPCVRELQKRHPNLHPELIHGSPN